MTPLDFALTVAATTVVVLAAQRAVAAWRLGRVRAVNRRLLTRPPSRIETEAQAVGWCSAGDWCPHHNPTTKETT